LSQLFIEAVIQSRLNLKIKTTKIRLDNYIIHIMYYIIISVALSFTIVGLNNKKSKQYILTKNTRLPIM